MILKDQILHQPNKIFRLFYENQRIFVWLLWILCLQQPDTQPVTTAWYRTVFTTVWHTACYNSLIQNTVFTTAWHTAQCYNSLIQKSVHNSLTHSLLQQPNTEQCSQQPNTEQCPQQPDTGPCSFLFHCTTAPNGPEPPHYRGFTVTLRHTTLGRIPLDEWSALRRHKDLHQTTCNTRKRQIPMPPAALEPGN